MSRERGRFMSLDMKSYRLKAVLSGRSQGEQLAKSTAAFLDRFAKKFLLGSTLMLFALSFAGCPSTFYNVLGNKINVPQLAIVPSAVTLKFTDTVMFGATGGVPPYLFSVASGAGTINSSTGTYTAPSAPGTTIIQVTDKRGSTNSATVTITPTSPLILTPTSATLNSGGTLTFIATGGTAPYTFSITSAGSSPPAPTINAATGVYTAGSNLGVDTIRVTDSTSAIATASVTVTNAVTNVNYTVTGAAFPTSGTAGVAIAAGSYTFTVQNSGSANGTQPVNWVVFLSSSSTLGSGATILETGSVASGLGAGASANVGVSWVWPNVGGTMYLYVHVSANDDLTQFNYSVPSTVTLTLPSVDYTVSNVAPSGGSASVGSAVSGGSFQLNNVGGVNGVQPVNWSVFAYNPSTASYILVGSGATTSGVNGLSSTSVSFTGTWPSVAGSYYLIVQVSAADATTTSNGESSSPTTLS